MTRTPTSIASIALISTLILAFFFHTDLVHAQEQQSSVVAAGGEVEETIQIGEEFSSSEKDPTSSQTKPPNKNPFDNGIKFLTEKFFSSNRKDNNGDLSKTKTIKDGTSQNNENPQQSNDIVSNLFDSFKGLLTLLEDGDDTKDNKQQKHPRSIETILEEAKLVSQMANEKETNRSIKDILDLFMNSFDQARETIIRHLDEKNIQFDKLPLSFLYYLEKEDELKNPSWKRRAHRYYRELELEKAYELHNSLYLSHLSYADTVEDIQKGIEDFADDLELLHVKTEALPGEPAHFVAANRQQIKDDDGQQCSQKRSDDDISSRKYDVVVVVRGTKEVGDVLTDALLDGVTYKSGSAHSGVFQGGKYIVEKHIELLEHLRQNLGRQKLRVALIGHSLGAGAASVAATLFREYYHDTIEAKAVGFGCPAIFSSELSESTKDYITTVVVDSDVVPRASGATLVNIMLDMMAYDWTERAIEDVKQLLDFMKSLVPFDIVPEEQILKFLEAHLDKHDRPFFETVTKERPIPDLSPPGTCIHLFRDGVGWSGKYTPCDFFDEVDITRTMLFDHLIPEGYHRALLDFVRDQVRNLAFDFDHDLLGLPI